MQNMLGAFPNMVDGYAIYQKGKQARGNYLSALAMNSQGEQREKALAQLAGVDAGQAYNLKTDLDKQDYTDLIDASKMMLSFKGTPQADAMYQHVAPKFSQKYGMQLPPQLDDSVWRAIDQIVGATQGDTRWIQTVDENNQPVWAAATNQGIAPTQHRVPDSYKFDSDPATGLQYRYGAKTGTREALGGATPVASVNPRQFFNDIANAFGAQITSVDRTPKHNRKVGGVNNSYHLSGQAADFVVPPQAKAQFIRAAQQNGYEAIDEGDHIHLEPQGQRGGGYVGMSAAEKARAEAQAKADVALGMDPEIERRKAEAKYLAEAENAPEIAASVAEATATGKTRGERAGAAEKKVADAKTTIALLDEAEKLLGYATGGYFGAQADAAYATIGKSTEGAKANAQLSIIAPQLIGMVPRMEGPQSDADRRLYENAAGDLNNANKPASIRLAALKQMRRLAEKYAKSSQKPNAPAGEPQRIRIKL